MIIHTWTVIFNENGDSTAKMTCYPLYVDCCFNSLWTVFTMKCTANTIPITLNTLFMWLYLIIVVWIQNLIYHFDYIQFWTNSHRVFAFSSLSLLTVMLTLISKFFVAWLNKMLKTFISKTPPKLRLLSKQKPCFLMPWV